MLEVHAEVEREAAVVRRVERVVADVGQADVVGQVGVEQVEAYAASNAQAAVKALEGVVGERAEGLARAEVLYLSAYSVGQVSSEEGLQREVAVDGVDVLQHDGHFDVVEVVGHFLPFARGCRYPLASSLLGVLQSGLKVQRYVLRQRQAHKGAHA